MKTDPFPRRIVTGENFCNRTKERAKLEALLEQGTHVWLQAHRRHGKSSLLSQVGLDMSEHGKKVILERCHILFNSGKDSLLKQLTRTTSDLLGAAAQLQATYQGYTKAEAIMDYLKEKFESRRLNIKLERGMPSITFEDIEANTTVDTFRAAMKELDAYAYSCDIRVVFVIDEFQELGKIDGGNEIESAIRDQLELSKSITFVFCGSERALMAQSMSDSKRPLYNHTKSFKLDRIAPIHYKNHLDNKALEKWGDVLNEGVIDKILALTECHPYYVNVICSELWLLEEKPELIDVEEAWDEVIDMSAKEEQGVIQSWSTNDKKMLLLIANGHTENLTSGEMLQKVGIASSSANRSIKNLIKRDLIEKNKDGAYRIINPVIAEIARQSA